jgi:hypothetical protein
VKIRSVQTISRKGLASARNPQRLQARHPGWVKIESDLHGDMQRPAEMSGPSNQELVKVELI